MEISIEFNLEEITVGLTPSRNSGSIELLDLSADAINAMVFRSAEFCYVPNIFARKPSDRQVIHFLRELASVSGIKLSKELLRTIKLTPSDSELLYLQLANPEKQTPIIHKGK